MNDHITDERRAELIALLQITARTAHLETITTTALRDTDACDILAMLKQGEELPWKVRHNGDELIIATRHKDDAEQWVGSRFLSGYTITGPDGSFLERLSKAHATGASLTGGLSVDDAIAEVRGAELGFPTITVKPYEPPKPTLDQMPEDEPHRCYKQSLGETQVVLLHRQGRVYECLATGEADGEPYTETRPTGYTVLDTSPPQPKTLADVPEYCRAVAPGKDGCDAVAYRDERGYVCDVEGRAVYDDPADVKITRVLGFPVLTHATESSQ